MLKVYKASAGSGKTFRLVTEYLKMALKGDTRYRHILAVTFTNKATAEMKERIIKQLHLLAKGEDTPYKKILIEETGLSEDTLSSNARELLHHILFDYHRFGVSTIDSFTQKIIKSFNREVGINPNYQIELDNQIIVNESVDRIISSIGLNKKLQKWFEQFIDEKIRNNKNFDIEKDIKSLGTELFKETVQNRILDLQDFFRLKDNSKIYLEKLDTLIFAFEGTLEKKAQEIVGMYSAVGFTADDFSYKKGGVAGFLEKLAAGVIPEEISSRTVDAANSDEKWVAGNGAGAEIRQLVQKKLNPALNRLIDYYNSNSVVYFTARSIKSEWYTMAVLMDLYEEISRLNREREVLPLASSNLLLKSIIDGNETPFIYEKTGTNLHHFMLDEFQDTSVIQWENLKPLISNSMGMGYDNLVVGDVKQSIYRWRNSSWDILAHHVMHDFPGHKVPVVTLSANYRSRNNIVTFNNLFFRKLSEQIMSGENIQPVKDQYSPYLESIYSDMEQQPLPDETGGYIRAELICADASDYPLMSMQKLLEQVKFLQDSGYKASGMAILVRTNVQGADIVGFFLDAARLPENEGYNLRVISGESLFLRASLAVNFIVHIIKHLSDKENRLYKATLVQLLKNLSQPSAQSGIMISPEGFSDAMGQFDLDFETSIAPRIRNLEMQILTLGIDEVIIQICYSFRLFEISSEIPYIQALIDKTAEIRKKLVNDPSGFLSWWNDSGNKESLKITESADAIKILTVHKSKGLEFDVVFMPFLNWKLTENKGNILWCRPETEPFNMAPLVPVTFSSGLRNTLFRQDYYLELFNQIIDNLNLIYVAFTRAKSALVLNIPEKSNRDSIASYIFNSLDMVRQATGVSDVQSCDTVILEMGTAGNLKPSKEEVKPEEALKWHFNPFSERLRLKSESDDFLQLLEEGKTSRNTGNVIHSILAEVRVADDMEPALTRAAREKMIRPGDLDILRQKLAAITAHPSGRRWFSGNYSVLNETDILTPSHIYRPDRIMVQGDTAIVVDFKSGMAKKKSHQTQVSEYIQVLLDTGFARVDGYLWYLSTNEIVKVSAD